MLNIDILQTWEKAAVNLTMSNLNLITRLQRMMMILKDVKEKKINTMNILENENLSDNSEELDLYSSRLENLHWFSCFECGISLTMRVQECKCCIECKSL